jgi:small subunit ribosomal protein S16
MAVKIRLSRIGKKNRPYCRIVAIDSQKKRDGASLENLGSYDPVTHKVIQLHIDKIEHWISKGAKCSAAVEKLIKNNKTISTKAKAA